MGHGGDEVGLHPRHGEISADGVRDEVRAGYEEGHHHARDEQKEALPHEHPGVVEALRAGHIKRPRQARFGRGADGGVAGSAATPGDDAAFAIHRRAGDVSRREHWFQERFRPD